MNYLGDWGMQFGEGITRMSCRFSFYVFLCLHSRNYIYNGLLCCASGLLGAGFEQFGSQEKLNVNPLQHLFDVS